MTTPTGTPLRPVQDHPHSTAKKYYEAMTEDTPTWLKPIQRFFLFGKYQREWNRGGHHVSWTTCSSDKKECKGYHALVRGDGLVQLGPDCSGPREWNERHPFHEATINNGWLHGTDDNGDRYNNPPKCCPWDNRTRRV